MALSLLATLAPALLAPQVDLLPPQHLVLVDAGLEGLHRLRSLDLDLASVDPTTGRAQVIVDGEELVRLRATDLPVRLLIEDLSAWYAARLEGPPTEAPGGSYGAWLSPAFGQGGMGGYYTYAQIGAVLDQMRAAYPNLVSIKQNIGNSLQGRALWMVKISDNPDVDEAEPEVRVDALHHAREPEGMQVLLYYMCYLLEEYGNDPVATHLVNSRELYFVPCVNPDGYEYNRSIAPNGGGLWRKNRRNNAGGSVGVDLNRNYSNHWGFDGNGSSTDPNSEVYRGTAPASEPEVQAMAAFISGRDFQTAVSLHTYSNLWLSPWGYDTLYPTNWSQYQEVGGLATEVNGYPHGPASIILYEANGVTVDYDHGDHGSLAWTPEIGGDNDGFWPAQNRIIPLAEENRLALARTALAGGPWLRLQDAVLTDAGDGDGYYEAGESVQLVADLRNSGRLASGAIDLTLSTASNAVLITTGSTAMAGIAAFSNGSNTTPLALQVKPTAQPGTRVDLTLTIGYDGASEEAPFHFYVGEEVRLVAFDFEAGSDEGWAVGAPNDATTGQWVRVNPNGTAAQPEDDHSVPGTICWVTGQGTVGGSVGENDVDGGRTTLISPVFDLAGRSVPRIRYWRWYSNDEGSAPNEDIFEIGLSNDGGATWSVAETVGPVGVEASGGWFAHELDVESILTPTSQMRMRFIASDLGSGSIVEAALDDFEVTYFEGTTCPPPVNYCVGASNSAGPGSSISWSGSTSVLANDFGLTSAGNPNNQFGVFYMGPTQANVAFGNGFRCVGGQLTRYPLVSSDGSGNAAYSVDNAVPPALGKIVSGSTWNWQYWYRDPMGGGANFNLSDGLSVIYCP